MRRRLALAGAALLTVGFALAGARTAATAAEPRDSCTTRPHLTGSFIQPDLPGAWTAAQWRTELRNLRTACIDEQILQWTADSRAGTTVYPTLLTGYHQSSPTDVVGGELSAADAVGVRVHVGLQLNDDWWTKGASDPAWLDHEADTAIALADELWARYRQHRSFAGWYLAFEVDNDNFTTQESWDTMAAFYGKVTRHLHALSPGKPVSTAPFYSTSGTLTPAQWTQMWTSILTQAQLDIIALQDGVGVGHATTGDLADWFRATRTAIRAAHSGAKLFSDTETFNADQVSMPIGGIVADMTAVDTYASGLWSFAYDHFQSPMQADPRYDRAYRRYLATGAVERTPPTTPSGLQATATGPLTVGLSWRAARDASGVVGYRIYRNGTLLRTSYGSATTATDSAADPTTAYTYQIRALDPNGNVSGASQPASATTPAAPVYPTNLAAGRGYTADVPADDSYPDSGAELTDGALAGTDFTAAGWQGRTSTDYTFTVDLGAAHTIREVNSDWLQSQDVGIVLPASVTYAVSTDGAAFTDVGQVPASSVGPDNQTRRYRVIQLDVSARYVRVTVHTSGDWSFVDEVEVRTDSV